MQEFEESHEPTPVPTNKICPFLSNADKFIQCLREQCGLWVINECALVRLTKGKQTL